MNILIGLLVIVFIILTAIVIGKTQTILKGISPETSTEETVNELDGANNANAIGMFVFWILSAVGLFWSYMVYSKDFLPEASSVHGKETDFYFWLSMGVITLAFFVVNSILFYFCYRYRFNSNRKATFYSHNNNLEVIWTVIPAVVMAGLVFSGLQVWNKVMDEAPEGAEVVEIMGKQFAWNARYPGADNKLGDYSFKLFDDVGGNAFGLNFQDEAALDDFTSGTELHIPKGKPVLLKIRSRDVLHSVFIPHMRVKMDAVPGMPTKFWFVADESTNDVRAKTGNPDFNFEIACTEICGKSHFGMKFILVVDEPKDYEKWKSEQKPFLTMNPAYIETVPEKLKAKAMKFHPDYQAESTITEVVAEEVVAEAATVIEEAAH